MNINHKNPCVRYAMIFALIENRFKKIHSEEKYDKAIEYLNIYSYLLYYKTIQEREGVF